jgi:hypothetical protein
LARLEKSDYPVFNFGQSHFGRDREEDRPKDLKIKDVLWPGKILEGDKEPIEKNSKPKAEVAKTGGSSFQNRNVRFL